MLQRVTLERELVENAPLLVLAEPERGLDTANKARLNGKLLEYVEENRGILVFSTDIDELVGLCHRIFVLRNGVFSAELTIDHNETQFYRAQIGRAMVGYESAS